MLDLIRVAMLSCLTLVLPGTSHAKTKAMMKKKGDDDQLEGSTTSFGPLVDRCGTLRYMAPELGLVLGHGFKADVYSFGLILWEICALKTPYKEIEHYNKFYESVWVRAH